MKKVYERPMMICDRFAVDEYCAMCGEVEKKYYFDCNEDPGFVGVVYQESNGQAGFQFPWPSANGDGVYAESFNDCNYHHELTEDQLGGLLNGYVVKHVDGSGEVLSAVPVLIYTAGGTNCHCTTNVNIDSWEVNLS